MTPRTLPRQDGLAKSPRDTRRGLIQRPTPGEEANYDRTHIAEGRQRTHYFLYRRAVVRSTSLPG